ncbi:ComEA family DNA-binding protein [Thermodesulfobacteriota bacterium]
MRIRNFKPVGYLPLFFIILLTINAMPVFAEEALVGKTVNVNTATVEEFVKNVPLITPELAENIVEYREEAGDFMMLEELLQVDGFDRKLLKKVKNFLLLEGIGGDECTC